MEALLRCENVSKHFGGIVALDEFESTIQSGIITGLIGPNGAGKTTLFNVVSGVLAPDKGRIIFDGEDVTSLAPHERCHAGIARTFQTPHPIESLTVEENLRVAGKFGTTGADGVEPRLDRTIETLELADERTTDADSLQMVKRKYVDLGRALLTMPDLVLLDEMLAGLNPAEKDGMIARIQRLHGEFDVDFFVVEHDLSAIRELTDQIVVMNEGKFMTTGSPTDVLEDDRVKEAYIGT